VAAARESTAIEARSPLRIEVLSMMWFSFEADGDNHVALRDYGQ
jgi:hypothetical protein